MKTRYKYIILLLWTFSILTTSTWGQTPVRKYVSESHVLEGNIGFDYGTHTYLARKSIRLQPGFRFAGARNKSLHAKIDYTLFKSADYYPQINNNTSPEYPDNRKQDTSLEIGSIPGEVNVNSSGVVSYSMPIELPDGPSGLVPALSVVYSSGGGNSVLGHGFNLVGISKISRTVKDIYNDGTFQAISSVNNTYSLDGERLLSADGEFFDTEKEKKGTSIRKIGTGNPYFVITDSIENTLFEYGRSNNSQKGIFWNINKVKDRFDNTIEYFYKQKLQLSYLDSGREYIEQTKHTDDECIIEKIVYGANEILFYYSLRDDNFHLKYNDDNLQSGLSTLLDEIVIKCRGEVYGSYTFKYMKNSLGYSCLTEITKKNGAGESLNPTLFRWNRLNSHQLEGKTINMTIPAFNKETDFVADFNNDGISDILIKKSANTYTLYEFNSSGHASTRTLNFTGELLCVGDYNGDGRTDILGYDNGSCIFLNITTDGVNEIGRIQSEKPHKVTADLNSNGKTDIYVTKNNFLTLYEFKNSNQFDDESAQNIRYHEGTVKSILTGDFNADGYTDLIINGYIYGYSNAQGGFSWRTKPEDKYSGGYADVFGAFDTNNDGQTELLKHEIVKCEVRTDICDINGDGDYEDDFVVEYTYYRYYDSYGGLIDEGYELNSCYPHVYDQSYLLNYLDRDGEIIDDRGDRIKYRKHIYEYSSSYYPCGKSFQGMKIDIGRSGNVDLNGDGIPEYLIYEEDNQRLFLFRTQPASGEEPIIEEILEPGSIAGDFNGDGATDFIKGNYMYYSSNPKTNSIAAIIDGNNHRTELTYSRIYDRNGTTPGHPLINMPGPFQVVSKIRKTVGNQVFETDYAYSESRFHSGGKGFLGFCRFTETSEFTRTTSVVENYHPEYIIPVKSKSIVENKFMTNNNISETESEISVVSKNKGSLKHFALARQTITTTDIDKNKAKETVEYDTGSGLPAKQITEKYREGYPPVTRTEATLMGRTDDAYRLPRQINTIINRTGITNPISLSVNYTYENGLVKTKTEKGLTHTYGYDDRGNVTEEKITADDMEPQINRYEYDARHIYPVRHINPLGQHTTKKYDPRGNVTEETDLRGKTSYYTYNNWGDLISARTPDGYTYTYEKKYADASAPQGAYYYTAVYKNGMLDKKDYYDHFGQNIRSISVGYGGKLLHADKTYDRRGNISSASEVYPANGQADMITEYEYDSYGRLITETGPTLTREIAYNVNTVTTTIDKDGVTETFYKEYDASGFMIKAGDNGGDIVYTPAVDNKLAKIESPGGRITEIKYDDSRRKKELTDADAGKYVYTYYKNGNVKTHVNANGKTTTYTYDKLNRVKTENNDGIVYTYTYDASSNSIGLLTGIISNMPKADGEYYTYDTGGLGRVVEKTRRNNEKTLTYKYQYDSKGRVSKMTYPGNFSLAYTYNNYDDLVDIRNADNNTMIWHLDAVNTLGQKTKVSYGSGRQTTYSYDTYHRLTGISAPQVVDFHYRFNDRQQLDSREEKYRTTNDWIGFREEFTFDNLNRLKTARVQGEEKMRMAYTTDGANSQIWSKTGVGSEFQYNYGSGYPVNNKLQGFTAASGYSPPSQEITYTPCLKVESITDQLSPTQTRRLQIEYGIDNQRFKQTYTGEAGAITSTWYMDGYEEITLPGNVTRKLNYIFAGDELVAINVQSSDAVNGMHYVYTDYLGSLRCVTDDSGAIEYRLSFDAWGNRRDPATGELISNPLPGLFTSRGFTGHEHLDAFGLINMNGRMYDPALSMFLSPDPYIQAPDFTQNFNRYAYCLNNPLMYTDPSGEFIFTALLAPIGLAPLGIIIDGACWSAAIDAGIQGVRMATGKQEQFNWAELGGAAVGGAVFAGMGLIAPSFSVSSTSFITNFPQYAKKAGWAVLAGTTSTGAGMFASDMFDNGDIDFSGKEYLKAIGSAGLISGGISFAGSIVDYATWDRLNTTQKIEKLKTKFDADIRYNSSLSAKGQYRSGNTYIEIGPAGLTSKGQAFYTTSHELKHLSDWNKHSAGKLNIPARRGLRNHFEIRAHKHSMRRYSTSYDLWIDRHDLMRGRGAYSGKGYGYKGFVFSFGIDQLWNFFY